MNRKSTFVTSEKFTQKVSPNSELDKDLIKFPIKGIEKRDPAVLNSQLLDDLRSLFDKSQPINKENQINVEELNILQSSQTDNAQGKISDFGVSTKESLHSSEDILVVPGPSGYRRSESGQNLLADKLPISDPVEIQSVDLRDKKKFGCRVCDKGIDDHGESCTGTKSYFCCVCRYHTPRRASFQMHMDIHCGKRICNVCTREYKEGDPHDSEHTCKVCEKKFQCKTFLDQHSVDHEEYFKTHCWICNNDFYAHYNKYNRKYECCACGLCSSNLAQHLNTHHPKLFCIICKEEYPIIEKNLHGKEWKCIVCEAKFPCQTLLENHFVDHKSYFSPDCSLCKREVSLHRKGHLFHCCVCSTEFYAIRSLDQHIHKHTGLRLFKCDVCGGRFSLQKCLKVHSEKCEPLPEICEICRARFPNSGSLETHRLEKHSESGEENQVCKNVDPDFYMQADGQTRKT